MFWNHQFGKYNIIEGSLEVKLPTIWRDEKAVSREKSQKRKDQKKEDADARKGRKVTKHCVFSWFCGSGGLKSRLAKAAGAETSGKMRDEKLHAVVARSRLTQLCNPTAYLNLPPTSFFRPCAKVLFFQYPENFSGPTLKFRTWPFWGINGNGNHWVQTCETNIWWIFKPLALIHANKSTPSPNSWQGRIRI